MGLGLRSFNTLIIDGDIESNPGPTYVIEKAICGSYHQGDRRFDDTTGVQCACNSLYTLCRSQIRKVGFWDRLDSDHILIEGDNSYKTLNTFDMLSVDDLPCFVRVYDENRQIEFLQLETKLASLTYGGPFLRNIVSNTENVLFLLFMGGGTTAVISSQNFFYVFDSHGGDEMGLNIANGRSVLFKFRYIFKIEKYIQVAYLEYRDQQQCISKHSLSESKQRPLTFYRSVLNIKRVSNVIITNNITERIHQIKVKRKGKFILKSLVHHHMIS